MSNNQKSHIRAISATELNLKSGTILRRVAVDQEHIVIERSGYPLAVIIPIRDYRKLVGKEEMPPSDE